MEIPLNAEVECVDGVCGRTEYILINPVAEKVTHVVVKSNMAPHNEYTVPVNLVAETKADHIKLSIYRKELE